MTQKIKQKLEGVSETLLMTLYARASESQRPNPLIRDEKAVEMVNQIDRDFSQLRMHRHDEIAVIARMTKFDKEVRDFLTRNQVGVVVHIGCGLDTRFERVDNGKVEWFDLDMPDVMMLRDQLIHTENNRYHCLAASVFDDSWFEEVNRYRQHTFLFVAEGVFPYFDERMIRSLFLKLRERFPGCEVVFDAHTPLVITLDNLHLALAKAKVRLRWSLKRGTDIESWGDDIHMISEWHYFEDKESPLQTIRWMRLIPFFSKSSGIFHYKLGIQP